LDYDRKTRRKERKKNKKGLHHQNVSQCMWLFLHA
jgi:hypothetical protein